MAKEYPRTQRFSGFTVVEILVVLGVICLLTALLLLVFGHVREGTRRTTCNSNLRQIGVAIEQYVQDNNRFYPPWRLSNYTCRWVDCVAPYVKETKVFECPSLKDGQYEPVSTCYLIDNSDQAALAASAYRKLGSYALNRMGDLLQPPLHPVVSEVRLRRPDSIILALDGVGGGDPYSGNADTPNLSTEQELLDSGLRPRHLNGNNVLFVDGHVKWMTFPSLAQSRLWRATER